MQSIRAQDNETLFQVSQRVGCNAEHLLAANKGHISNLTMDAKLVPGTKLVLYSDPSVVIQQQSYSRVSQKHRPQQYAQSYQTATQKPLDTRIEAKSYQHQQDAPDRPLQLSAATPNRKAVTPAATSVHRLSAQIYSDTNAKTDDDRSNCNSTGRGLVVMNHRMMYDNTYVNPHGHGNAYHHSSRQSERSPPLSLNEAAPMAKLPAHMPRAETAKQKMAIPVAQVNTHPGLEEKYRLKDQGQAPVQAESLSASNSTAFAQIVAPEKTGSHRNAIRCTYRTVANDTVRSIASKLGCDEQELLAQNNSRICGLSLDAELMFGTNIIYIATQAYRTENGNAAGKGREYDSPNASANGKEHENSNTHAYLNTNINTNTNANINAKRTNGEIEGNTSEKKSKHSVNKSERTGQNSDIEGELRSEWKEQHYWTSSNETIRTIAERLRCEARQLLAFNAHRIPRLTLDIPLACNTHLKYMKAIKHEKEVINANTNASVNTSLPSCDRSAAEIQVHQEKKNYSDSFINAAQRHQKQVRGILRLWLGI